MFDRPTQTSTRGREALPEVWEVSGGPPGGLGVPSRSSRGVGCPTKKSVRCWEANLMIREAHPKVW